VGSVAQWNVNNVTGMKVGHAGMVKAVNGDSIDIEQYNLREDGKYSVLHMAKNASAIDQSNGHGAWAVPWPDNFIHVHGRWRPATRRTRYRNTQEHRRCSEGHPRSQAIGPLQNLAVQRPEPLPSTPFQNQEHKFDA
jgi:hypothetical protein